MENYYNVGKIVNTHGTRGEVRVLSRTDFPEERYKKGSILYVQKENQKDLLEVKVESHRTHKQFDLLTLENVASMTEAEALKNSILKVHESSLGELAENEYYFHEIIGCTVSTVDGEEIGNISEILTPGANDVWVVKRKGGKEAYIPYIEQVVLKVNVEDKVVIIDPMEGLLD
ncbi:ribosome maturation factor RimM [Mangrovibacillus cuniculi]|uniref:Ribosome maturation factor RimM n=1 Tax=Mangrovibacillus cuniculi TaxID=2593652 RepID=A0A7S8CAB9_9BACI|nr:ribosome maturation factor RimM [Mangrovibacillus cuniculi]QPC46322.1 ribosome maturation factor RimM [Mangrovibacillus cuniculi]